MGGGSGKTPREFEGEPGGAGVGVASIEGLLEGELSETDLKTSTVLRGLEELVVYQDLHNRIVWTNRAAGDSVGKDARDLVGRLCYEVWHGRSEPCDDCPVVRARETGEPQEGEIRSPDGRHWLIHGFPILDDAGQVAGVVEITSEITSRKKTEEAYKRLAEHSLQGLGIFQDRKLVLANTALAEMLGRPLDVLYSMSFEDILDVVHPDDRELLRTSLRDRFQGKPVPEKQGYRIVRTDGEVRTLETLSKMTEYQGAPALQVAYWDVTDTLRVQDAYRTLVESSLQGFSIVQDGKPVYSNPAALEISGYSAAELYASSPEEIMDMIHPDDRGRALQNFADIVAENPVDLRQAYRIVRKDGESRWIDTMAEVIEYKGRPALQMAMTDVTETRLAQDRLRKERDR
ncbi:MAG: PAS domain S-box protein, partial [Deltaproteobacteria bacterium]|nr:PAS domain S-box protein [Deltaproteobacteria bacterium]